MPPLEAVALLLRTKSRAPGRMELNPEGSLGAEGNSKQGGSPRGTHHSLVTMEHNTMQSGPLAMLP